MPEPEQKDEPTIEVEPKETTNTTVDEAVDQVAAQPETEPVRADGPMQPTTKKKRWAFLKSKKFLIPASIILLLIILFAMPFTRYAILGNFIKRDVLVQVNDSKTSKPVTGVDVSLAGQTAKTDQSGKAEFKQVPVGNYTASVKKKYYKDSNSSLEVGLFGGMPELKTQLEATGRQVPVKVINKISGKPVEKATITAQEAATITDAAGEAVIVLPADKTTEKATISGEGYNQTEVEVTITEQADDKNTFNLSPAGKLYFLSKRTGKIDVMKTNLDGSNPELVLAGTGKESEQETTLLAARDWSYLALKAHRDGDKAKLYLIETATGKLSVMDEGNADFWLSGWYNEYFMYKVERHDLKDWQPKKTALKSFNAKTGKITTLDETTTDGNQTEYNYQSMGIIYILNNELVYTKDWLSSYQYNAWQMLANKKLSINSVRPDGTNKKVVKEFQESTSYFMTAAAQLYKPGEMYFQVNETANNKYNYYEYENGNIKAGSAEKFNKVYPTFLVSPSGQKTFWYEPRDGKNVLFVGNAHADEAKELGAMSEYIPYGWFTDEYLLVAKNKSELWILPVAGDKPAQKVTDYHRPTYDIPAYGYGYGGQ